MLKIDLIKNKVFDINDSREKVCLEFQQKQNYICF